MKYNIAAKMSEPEPHAKRWILDKQSWKKLASYKLCFITKMDNIFYELQKESK